MTTQALPREVTPTRSSPPPAGPFPPDSPIGLAILAESLRHRAHAARIGLVGVLMAVVPFFIVLRGRVPTPNLVLWIGPVIGFMLWRAWLSLRTGEALAAGDVPAQRKRDREFRLCSILTQFWVGTGMWTVAGRSIEVDLYVTLGACIFGFGAGISLAHDHRSLRISIPLLFGQCILFWLLQGPETYEIAVPLMSVTFLIVAAAKRAEASLNESVAIRFENDELLMRLRREKESAIMEAERADAASRSKSHFMAAASHDLRQPLYAITLLADTLTHYALPPPAEKITAQLRRAIDALRLMFDNLLDLSRFDGGAVRPHVETVPLSNVLDGLVHEFGPVAAAKGLSISFPTTPHHVRTDVMLLSRLLGNLVSNAIRYTSTGEVAVGIEESPEQLTVSVRDTGCGMSPEDQERAFHEFVQLDNPARSRDKGVGLGLSIVRRIADLLGHRVELESGVGRGTTVRVTLPRTERLPATRPRGLPAGARVSAAVQSDLYLWVVEDDPLVREALATHFDAIGVRHDWATTRAELERLHRDRGLPDYALVDDMLGAGESGLELAGWLARYVAGDRILIVTGNADPERWKTLEASGFIAKRKPLSGGDLNRWLSR